MKVLEFSEFKKTYKNDFEIPLSVLKKVSKILHNVKLKGDEALYYYTLKFDKVKLKSLKVSKAEIKKAKKKIPLKFKKVLKKVCENIYHYQSKQVFNSFVMTRNSLLLGQKVEGVERAGVYIPGGTAPLVSTVLMTVIPAKIAGVKEIIAVVPPLKDGSVNPYILYALDYLKVKAIYKVGGAQAIGALAYGTKSIPKVSKIAGPGNIYVTAAKKLVYGNVDVDMIAGPSEIMVVADKSADPYNVALDILSQAEHDVLARTFLVTTSKNLSKVVLEIIKNKVKKLQRNEILKKSLKNFLIIIVKNKKQIVDVVNTISPEHLEIVVEKDINFYVSNLNAGAIFVGKYSAEPLGDYVAVPNHTLPTGGTAKFFSPLSPYFFQKFSSIICYDKNSFLEDKKLAESLAFVEGLISHYNSIKERKL